MEVFIDQERVNPFPAEIVLQHLTPAQTGQFYLSRGHNVWARLRLLGAWGQIFGGALTMIYFTFLVTYTIT